MTIILPPLPRSARYLMRKVYAASDTPRPSFGPGRPIDRPGDHWMIEVETPALKPGCGQAFMADIIQGRTTAIRIPQPDIDTGPVGPVVVDGSGASGESVPLKQITPGFAVRKGWFLSIITDGRRYTYQARAEVIAGADRRVSLPVWPMLLVPHADGDTVEIAEPWIEGPLTQGGDYEVSRPASVRPGTFSIEQQL